MTFREKFNIPKDATHKETYNIIIDGLGYENVKLLLPVDKQTIINALKEDEHLNNIPIKLWDNAAGFTMAKTPNGKMEPVFHNYGLRNLCREKGVTSYSPAELVCILKQCARRYAEE